MINTGSIWSPVGGGGVSVLVLIDEGQASDTFGVSVEHLAYLGPSIAPDAHLLVRRHSYQVAVVTCNVAIPHPAAMTWENRLLDVLLKLLNLIVLLIIFILAARANLRLVRGQRG